MEHCSTGHFFENSRSLLGVHLVAQLLSQRGNVFVKRGVHRLIEFFEGLQNLKGFVVKLDRHIGRVDFLPQEHNDGASAYDLSAIKVGVYAVMLRSALQLEVIDGFENEDEASSNGKYLEKPDFRLCSSCVSWYNGVVYYQKKDGALC